MTFKPVFSFVSDPDLAQPTLRHLAAQADLWDAHADLLCLGIDRS